MAIKVEQNKMWKRLSTPPPLFTSTDGDWPCYATGIPIPLEEQRKILSRLEFK